ncbi:MAG: pilus assembly protein TadG-related protein [Alphaproteobacteria bacterium]|nr:pilus assembly protein TadG-related protein [Alphaproteobacteria bacterium]
MCGRSGKALWILSGAVCRAGSFAVTVAARFKMAVGEFGRGDSGGVAVIFAITVTALLLVAAAAIDFSRWSAARAAVQAAIDGSVLSAVKQRQTNEEYASAFFKTTIAGTAAVNSIVEIPPLTCAMKGSVFTCNTSASLRTMMIGLLTGIKVLPLNVAASAGVGAGGQEPRKLTFTVARARGWSLKNLTVWIRKPGEDAVPAANIIYRPSSRDVNADGDVGYGFSCQISPGVSGVNGFDYKTCVQCATQCPEINLGSDYEYAYLSMQVWTDGCDNAHVDKGFIESPFRSTPVACGTLDKVEAGATDKTMLYAYQMQRISTYTLFSDRRPVLIDPISRQPVEQDTPGHIFIGGKRIDDLETSGSLLKFVDCNTPVVLSWEETLLGPASAQAWAAQDLILTVKATCGANFGISSGAVKLTE